MDLHCEAVLHFPTRGGEEREKEARKVRPDEDNACIMERENSGRRQRASERERRPLLLCYDPLGLAGLGCVCRGIVGDLQ